MHILLLLFSFTARDHREQDILLRQVRWVDVGSGRTEGPFDLLLRGGKVVATGKTAAGKAVTGTDLAAGESVFVLDGSGKFLLPSLYSAHVHVGTLAGTAIRSENYTRANILRQLQHYASFGVRGVLSMGTDHPLLFNDGLYDSLQQGMPGAARMLSAGYGFSVPGGAPGAAFPMDRLFRPATPAAAEKAVDSLAAMGIRFIKIWVDDFGSGAPKMDPEIYGAIIKRAHQHGQKVVAHVYYLADARRLVDAGIDVLGHSIRDSLVDDYFIRRMKAAKTILIPTLTLDAFAVAYAGTPSWMGDSSFIRSLEPGVYEMIRSDSFRVSVQQGSQYQRNLRGLEIARQNLRRLAAAGIPVCLGTDSGALPIRAQGFGEHLELQLMTEAGLTPAAALRAATMGAREMLFPGAFSGRLEKGMAADFLLLDGNPLEDIRHTRAIRAVVQQGKLIYVKP